MKWRARLGLSGRSGRSSDSHHCPYCGTSLTRFECRSCEIEFVFDAETDKLVERAWKEAGMLRPPGWQPPEIPQRTEILCDRCALPLSNESVMTPAWADGNNRYSYVTCADCGWRNDTEM